MNQSEKERISLRLTEVQNRIRKAAQSAERDPSEIELVVVTKEKSAVVIKNLVELGVKSIGESYLNEASFKQDILSDYDIDWHMIGVIQRSKVNQIVARFSQIHSVDKLSIADLIQKRASSMEKVLQVYLELNLSNEPTKHGWKFGNDEERDQFFTDVERMIHFDSLEIKGLMTMAPYSTNPENSRSYFKELRLVRDELISQLRQFDVLGLSMGMSGDFEVAIDEGATVLRIGSAIVGER